MIEATRESAPLGEDTDASGPAVDVGTRLGGGIRAGVIHKDNFEVGVILIAKGIQGLGQQLRPVVMGHANTHL